MGETPLYSPMDAQVRLLKEHVEYVFEWTGHTVKDF